MAEERLILFPKDPLLQITLEPFIHQLQAQQVMGDQLSEPYDSSCYRVGERFFDAFLFLGCSPSIELDPAEDGSPFCYLQLESEAQSRVVTGSNLKAACSTCKHRYGELGLSVSEGVPEVQCLHCGAVALADKIAWRKSGAVSKTRISLWNIFEGEAVPSDLLFKLLERESGVGWGYAYISEAG